jgi:hypothetical protein
MESKLTATAPPRAPAREKQPRRYELDWCRAFIVLALIPIHAAGLFTQPLTRSSARRTPVRSACPS